MVSPRPGRCLLPLKPGIKDFGEVLFRNALSGVGEINNREPAMLTGGDGQGTARRGMPEGIDRKIQNDLLQTIGIALDLDIVNFHVDREFDSSLLGQRTDEGDPVL